MIRSLTTLLLTTASVGLCASLPKSAPASGWPEIAKGLSHDEIVDIMASKAAPHEAMGPDDKPLTREEIDELDWSEWVPHPHDEPISALISENPHEFDSDPEDLEWDGEGEAPEWFEIVEYDDDSGMEVSNTTLSDAMDDDEDDDDDDVDEEDEDDVTDGSLLNFLSKRAFKTRVQMSPQRTTYGDTTPKQVFKAVKKRCGPYSCNVNFNMGTRLLHSTGKINVNVVGSFPGGNKNKPKFIKLLKKIMTSKTKIVKEGTGICNNWGTCDRLTTYRAANYFAINRFKDGQLEAGKLTVRVRLSRKGGLACAVVNAVLGGIIGGYSGGAASFFGGMNALCQALT